MNKKETNKRYYDQSINPVEHHVRDKYIESIKIM